MSKLGSLIGNVLHHYDTSLFGWAAPFLAPLLFPGRSQIDALLLTFAFLPLSYFIKPLGSLFWGWVGDEWGRKPALIASLGGMAFATFAIGCVPLTSWAWIFVALCRVLQGFFSAGEEKGAALYLLEHTQKDKRPWMSAVYDGSGIAGIFLASLLVSLLGEHYWRYLFWIGALSGLVGLFLRHQGKETPEFKKSVFSWKKIWEEKIALGKIIIVSGFSYTNYFLITVFLNGFLPQITSLTKGEALSLNTYLLWIDFFLLLGFGALCQYLSKEKMMGIGALLAAFCAIPLFIQLNGASWLKVAGIRLIFVIFGTALAAPYHAWQLDILPLQNRFLLSGLGSTLGSKLFGAPIPLLATYLISKTGLIWTAGLPILIMGLLSSWVLLICNTKNSN